MTVKTVGYTGWKIVGAAALGGASLNALKTRILIVFIVAFVVFILAVINAYISTRITTPIEKLERSVNGIEAGNLETEVYVGGSYEIRHLGTSIRNMTTQIRHLMDDIVAEHESKRKNEFDVLQSQINPHFLYNTLDIIVWMIENEQKAEAVKVVTALARFFRISLSRGKTVISVEDELKHARNYMNIQKVRYKNIFEVRFDIDEEILQCCTVKLVVQPLLENAIYYGVECMDGDGEIEVRGYGRDDDVYIEVTDNGLGIPENQVEQLLKENNRVHKRGSGVGLLNVHNRIRLRFGEKYGLEIESVPDEGTTVRIHLPYIIYTPEEQERLEAGRKQL